MQEKVSSELWNPSSWIEERLAVTFHQKTRKEMAEKATSSLDKEQLTLKGRLKKTVSLGYDWLKQNFAVVVAVFMLMLCFGLPDVLKKVIDNTLLYVTNFSRSGWTDSLFAVLTIWVCIEVCHKWLYRNRRVAPHTTAQILVPLTLYLYYRIAKDSPYTFLCYLDGPITYLDGFALAAVAIIGLYLWQQYKKEKAKQTTDGYAFNIDAPITKSKEDLFNMDGLVERIVNYVSLTDVSNGAFSLGIEGKWGDGKTSLMNLVEEKIHQKHPLILVAHFNPRSSKKAENIQEDFLNALKQVLKPYHSGIDRIIDNYAIALDILPAVSPFVGKLLSLIQVHIDKNRKSTRRVLDEAIRDINRRIVVFIDDLDRLTGKELIEVMKVLDTNGAFPNVVFITSYDKRYVNTVLTNYLHLGEQLNPYTDKYFTVEVRVPLHPSYRLLDYLINLLSEGCKNKIITRVTQKDLEEQTRHYGYYLMKRLTTIRDVKRFANQFLYNYAGIQRDVRYSDFLLLELIRFEHPDDYEALHRQKLINRGTSTFLASSSRDLLYLNKDLQDQKSKEGDRILPPQNPPASLDILRLLFPFEDSYQNWWEGRYQRLCSVSSFEHYFYNYEYSHLTTEDIENLYRIDNLAEACTQIDKLAPYAKDMENYLLTRSVESISDKSVLRKYFLYLIYTGYSYNRSSYIGKEYTFLRREDVENIVKNCSFADTDDYLQWMKESLEQLSQISPLAASRFIQYPIIGLCERSVDPDLFAMTVEQLQSYALEQLKNYLKRRDGARWSAVTAFVMGQIRYDETPDFLPAANDALHDEVVQHFDSFSGELPVIAEQNGTCYVGYVLSFAFQALFGKDKDEFQRVINDKKYDGAPEIGLVRAIWPLYEANQYQMVALPQGMTAKEAKSTQLKDALTQLEQYKHIDRQLDVVADDWKKGHCISNVDVFINRVQALREELNAIPLKLHLAETYRIHMNDMVNDFQRYLRTARNLDAQTVRVGDFIKLKDDVYQRYLTEHPDKLPYDDNIFEITSINDKQITTQELDIPLTFDDVEAIFIGGNEDESVYYDSFIAGSVVTSDQPVPAHSTDYSYYLEHFKRCYDPENVSFYDRVEENGFQFLHEVQHWMEDEMNDRELRINHKLNKNHHYENNTSEEL